MVIFVIKSDYMNIAEASEKWGLSARRVQDLCKLGAVEGAIRFSHAWMIPKGASKPIDRRTRQARENKLTESNINLPMPRKSPFLDMTDLYSKAGTADQVIQSLVGNPEAQDLFAAEIAYCRGEIDRVIAYSNEFLNRYSGFYAVNAGGMLLALAAIWKGDIHLYREAKVHITKAPAKSDTDRDIMALSLACINSAVRDISNYPEWFRRGQFEYLPSDSHPAAKVFYIRYFIIAAQEHAKGGSFLPDVMGIGLMRMIPYIAEPLISRVVAEKLVIPEIYLRLLTAISYHQLGDDESAILHIDKAIALALPDNLLGILAEHRRNLDTLLDDRLMQADPGAFARFKVLHKGMLEGWTKLHNSLLSRSVSSALSSREREVARLAAFGFSNVEIAAQLSISVDTVKKSIFRIMNKTGVDKRDQLGAFV